MACIPVYKGKRFPSTEKLIQYLSTEEGMMAHLADGKDTEFIKAIEGVIGQPQSNQPLTNQTNAEPVPVRQPTPESASPADVEVSDDLQTQNPIVADKPFSAIMEFPTIGQTITTYGNQDETIVDIKDGKVYATPEGTKTKNIYSIEEWNEMVGKQDEIKSAIVERDAAFEASQKTESTKKEADNNFDGFDEGLSPIEKGKVAAYLNKQAFGKSIKDGLKSYAKKGAYVKNGKIVFDEGGQTIQIDNKYQTKTGVDFFNFIKDKVEQPKKSAYQEAQTVLAEAKTQIDNLSDSDVLRIVANYYGSEVDQGGERQLLLEGYANAKSIAESARDSGRNRLIKEVEEAASASPFTAFTLKGEAGRIARSELKEKVGKKDFADLERIHKNAEKILRSMPESFQIDCP